MQTSNADSGPDSPQTSSLDPDDEEPIEEFLDLLAKLMARQYFRENTGSPEAQRK